MSNERDGKLNLFHVHGEIILPLIVIAASFLFAFFSYISSEPPNLTGSEQLRPRAYLTTGRFEYGTPRNEAEDVDVRAPVAPQKTPVPVALKEWVVSQEPSDFYVVQKTAAYACPDPDCAVIATLDPGVYWKLPFTPSRDGWFQTNLLDTEEKGYISVALLSADIPGHCRLILPYRIGHIGERFIQEGFDLERVKGIVLDAERQIEDVIGRNVLSYDENAKNTVNFVISHYNDSEPFHRGLNVSSTVFSNDTVGAFWIGVYAALFDDIQSWRENQYIGPQHVEPFEENYIRKTILHELVHTLGFGHLDDPTAIMCGAPNCRPAVVNLTNERLLGLADKNAIKSWCD